jgi:hypothetical protein
VNPSRLVSLGVLVVSAGCAPSLATMQPAHVAPKGHFEVTTAVEIGIPTGTISRVYDTGKALARDAEQNMAITPAQERQVFEAGVNVAVSPPTAGYLLAANYTVLNNWEVGLRYASGSWRLGSRYQLLHREDGPFDMTFGAGVARQAVEIPLSDYIPILEVDDFTRYTIDAGLLIGTSRSFFRVWFGPKFLYSHYTTAMRLSIPGVDTPDLASFEGHGIYYGGQGGLAVGYRHIFFAVELTMAELTGTASVTAQTPAQNGSGEPIAASADISGFVIYPTFGLIGEF